MKKSLIRAAMGFGVSVAMAACGGKVIVDGLRNGPEHDPNFWINYCDARAKTCGTAADRCKAEEACARALLRDEIEDRLLNCMMMTCSQGDCVSQIAAEIGLSSKGEQFDSACSAYLAKCPNGNNDVCRTTAIVAD